MKLQRKPQLVLSSLLEQPGRIVTREQLHACLWPQGTYVDFDQGLNVAVKKLRAALGDSTEHPEYIATIAGSGYRFVARIDVWEDIEPEPAPGTPNGAPLAAAQTNPTARRPHWPVAAALAFLILLAVTVFFPMAMSRTRLKVQSTRSIIAPPLNLELMTTSDTAGPFTLSPDGTRAVFTAKSPAAAPQLFLRRVDALEAEPLAGTEGAAYPFWSPDGQRIGFFAHGKLKVLNLADRSVEVLYELIESPRGGTWGAGNTILFAASSRGPILKITARGGAATPVTRLAGSRFTTHRWPEFLPDGRHFLFVAASHDQGSPLRPALFLGSSNGEPPRLLVESDSNAQFADGQLLFAWGGKLVSQPFDPHTGKLESITRILAESVEVDPSVWHATFSTTPQILVYRPRSDNPDTQVPEWFDHSGKMLKRATHPGTFRGVSISPDGKTVAATCGDPDMSICLIHEDGTSTRVSEIPLSFSPVWSPDGTLLAFGTHRGEGISGLALKDLAGKNPERTLIEGREPIVPSSWAANRHELLLDRIRTDGKRELAILTLHDGQIRTFLSSHFSVSQGKFSPDGRWVAYQSDESGRDEISLTSYPFHSRTYIVSSGGGHAPRWGEHGESLYFLDPFDAIVRVRVTNVRDGVKLHAPERLFRPPIRPAPLDSECFDVSAREPRFLIAAVASANASPYVLLTSWSKIGRR